MEINVRVTIESIKELEGMEVHWMEKALLVSETLFEIISKLKDKQDKIATIIDQCTCVKLEELQHRRLNTLTGQSPVRRKGRRPKGINDPEIFEQFEKKLNEIYIAAQNAKKGEDE
jgi:hypothetical protein